MNFSVNDSSSFRRLASAQLLYASLGLASAMAMVQMQLAPWSNALFFCLPSVFLLSFIARSAFFVCRSLPFAKRQLYRVSMVYGISAVLSGAVWLLSCSLWNDFSLWIAVPWTGIKFGPEFKLAMMALGGALYVLALLINDAALAVEQIREAQRRENESILLAREAELQMLRTQINPHFLFNSLNSISALTTIAPQSARAMTIELANFFRHSLALSDKKFVTVEDELKLCDYFLSIEKIRFGEKLQVNMQIENNANAALLPPMLLQPLIENAIKHGIRNLVDGGTISCMIKVNAAWLHIAINNPVDSEITANPSNLGSGTGLKNIQSRLIRYYGDKCRFAWRKTAQHFEIEMTLPLSYTEP